MILFHFMSRTLRGNVAIPFFRIFLKKICWISWRWTRARQLSLTDSLLTNPSLNVLRRHGITILIFWEDGCSTLVAQRPVSDIKHLIMAHINEYHKISQPLSFRWPIVKYDSSKDSQSCLIFDVLKGANLTLRSTVGLFSKRNSSVSMTYCSWFLWTEVL